MVILSTDDTVFGSFPDFPYPARHVDLVDPDLGSLRVHYVDEGPRDADPVLLVHGQPTWSYLYRHVIADLVARGHRVIASDNVGFGRSSKLASKYEYTYERLVRWHSQFVEQLDLHEITVVGQDWGGPIGFGGLARAPQRYARAVATNTILHCADPAFADRLTWANNGVGETRVLLEERLVDYVVNSQRLPSLDIRAAIRRGARRELSDAELDAYAAPFPDEERRTGPRQITVLIPLTRNDPGSEISRTTWQALGRWNKPFLTAFSDGDPATAGFESLFRERVPGANHDDHVTIRDAGHFVQEDQPHQLAAAIAEFIART